jgi:hypothetical protein
MTTNWPDSMEKLHSSTAGWELWGKRSDTRSNSTVLTSGSRATGKVIS